MEQQQAQLLSPELSSSIWDLIQDPIRYCQDLLQVPLWDRQKEILNSLLKNRRTAVKACHSSGKTLVAALATLWWITRFPDGVVITTAPTWRQVKELLWREIQNAVLKAKINYPEPNKTQLSMGPKNFALGISTDDPDKFHGFHSRHLLVILDEAPGIRAEIWQAIKSLMAGGFVRLLALGNPTVPVGPFYDAFTKSRSTWSTLSIGAWDCPTLAGINLEQLIQGECQHGEPASGQCVQCGRDPLSWEFLISAEWVLEQYEDWGTSHPFWIARVEGEFPTEAEGQLFSLKDLEAAKNRLCDERHNHKDDQIEVGIDVAGEGADETVLQPRQGYCFMPGKAYHEKDPRGAVARDLHSFGDRLTVVRVDDTGIGHYFASHLTDLGFPVQRFIAGGTAEHPNRYINQRAEGYESFCQLFRSGLICGLEDEKTLGQLAGVRYELTGRGQVKIESKKDAKQRGIKSPDRADAAMMAFKSNTSGTIVLEHLHKVLIGQPVPTEDRPVSELSVIASNMTELPPEIQSRFTGRGQFGDAEQMIRWYEEAVEKYKKGAEDARLPKR